MQTFLDLLFQAVPARCILANLDFHRHFVAHHSVAYMALRNAEPFAGRTRIALDRRQAGLGPDTDAADTHHGIAAAQHLLHAAEAAAAFAAVGGNDTGEIAQIEADHRLLAPVQDRAD